MQPIEEINYLVEEAPVPSKIKYSNEAIILSQLSEKFKDSYKFYPVTHKTEFKNKKIKYCEIEIYSGGNFHVKSEGKFILHRTKNDDEDEDTISECLISKSKVLMLPLELGEIIFIGFPNDNRVYILPHAIINKYKQSVLYGYLESYGSNYNEKFVLDAFNYDTFRIAHIALMDPEKILAVPKHILSLMDKYGLVNEAIYYLNNKLTQVKNAKMDEFNDFINNSNKSFFTSSKDEYSMLKQMFSENYHIIPIQIMTRQNNYQSNIISLSAFNGLQLKFCDKKIEFDSNAISAAIDINQEKIKMLSQLKIIIQPLNNEWENENKIWNSDELISLRALLDAYVEYYLSFYTDKTHNISGCRNTNMLDLTKYTDNPTNFISIISDLIKQFLRSSSKPYYSINKIISVNNHGTEHYDIITYIGFVHI
jgi:hypothetical protein